MERLIVGESPRAYRLAMHLTRDSEESKELVQEASYRLLRSRQHYDTLRDGPAWFKTVLRNLFIDSRRSPARRHSISLDRPAAGGGGSLAETIPVLESDVAVCYERDDERRAVKRVLRRLGRHHKEALTLCDIQDLSYREAARALSLPMGTFRSRLHRARRSFRSLWMKEQLTNA